jgi:hypothetical protein
VPSSNAASGAAPAAPPEADLEPVRFSRLKLMGKSAAHYRAGFGGESGAMRKGTAVHSFMLGGQDKVAVYTGRRDERIAAWRDFQAANDGKTILIPSELAAADGMRAALEAHPRAMDLLSGIQEQRIEWTDLGRACAGTPDAVHLLANGKKVGVELKTCVTSHPERFTWQCRKMSYHAQCAWYKHGLERTLAYPPGAVTEFFVVVVETTVPHPVTVFRLDEESLRMGHKQCRLWLEQLLVCERAGHFPAYAENDVLLSVLDEADGLDWGDE